MRGLAHTLYSDDGRNFTPGAYGGGCVPLPECLVCECSVNLSMVIFAFTVSCFKALRYLELF
jgi:hypothetical protein